MGYCFGLNKSQKIKLCEFNVLQFFYTYIIIIIVKVKFDFYLHKKH